MNEYNTTLFSTSDNSKYALECILRLEQARKHMGKVPTYLIGSEFSQGIKTTAKAKNINIIEVGKTNKYFEKGWNYPKECYFWTFAPLYFKTKYALYIDGDVYCLKNPYIEEVHSITGITLRRNPGLTAKEIARYKQILPFDINRPRVNSGVLYMNLEFLREKNFTQIMSDLYHWSIKKGIPRKGDDSLFWVFVKTHDWGWGYLPIEYNWIKTEFGNPSKDTVWWHNNNP